MVIIVDIFDFWIKDVICSDAVYMQHISDISTIWHLFLIFGKLHGLKNIQLYFGLKEGCGASASKILKNKQHSTCWTWFFRILLIQSCDF